MPQTVRTISRLYLAIAGLILAFGLVAAMAFTFWRTNVANSNSTDVGACVNTNQRDARTATNLEAPARRAATNAEIVALRAEVAYLDGSGSRAVYVRASKDAIAKKTASAVAQDRAAAYRAAHPSGDC